MAALMGPLHGDPVNVVSLCYFTAEEGDNIDAKCLKINYN